MDKEMRKLINEVAQHQGSLYDQLLELHALANQNGLYDAADFIKSYIEKINAGS